jgi:signal transduction histidine kinase
VPRSPRSSADVVLAAAALAIGVAAESRSYAWGDAGRWLPDLLTGWTFIACGSVARGRTGVLLAACGVAWFAGNFASPALVLHRGPLAHLVLTYPQGAPGLLPAVALAYAAAAVGGAWLNDPATIVLAVGLVAGGAWRVLRAVGQRRREARYALRAVGVLAAVLGVVVTVDLTSNTAGAHDTALLVYEATLCAIAIYLAYGDLHRPWERPVVTDLVVDLGDTRTATARDALAQALGDPTLDVVYRLHGGYVDSAGRPTTVPTDAARHMTRIERDGEEVAVLVHDPAVLDDPGLVDAVGAAARLAAANARLQADVRAQVAELEGSRRRLLEAGDAERRRLEGRLRDGAVRRLGELEARLAIARATAGTAAAPAIGQAMEQLARTSAELRQLAAGLHPHELGEHGLAAAVASLAKRSPVPVDAHVQAGRLSDHLEAAIFFLCCEALANVAKHAGASRASISIEEREKSVSVEIGDDGRGGAEPRSIADRVEAVGGTLTVDSPVGGGTRLRAEIPRYG